MADQSDDDKTEQPTAKKLRDARKKGQVSKSRDVTSTAGMAAWLLLFVLALKWAGTEIMALMQVSFDILSQPFGQGAVLLASQALHTLVAVSAALLVPVLMTGVLAEFLQAGPVFSTEKLKPKLEGLNPVAGIKRMFGMDNLIEVVKSIIKTLALLAIGWLVLRTSLPVLALLPWAQRAQAVGAALRSVALPILTWTVALFALLSILDAAYQRWSFMKKMRMSLRDIKQEHKEQEGDPHVKGYRRQLAEEWSRQGATHAARGATAVITNPTHIAIAIDYDREVCPIPVVTAKGEGDLARDMRLAAEEAGVPIVRNVPLARDLMMRTEAGDVIPPDLFQIIADVILWAREVRDEVRRRDPRDEPAVDALHDALPQKPSRPAPGEDLTRYPQDRA